MKYKKQLEEKLKNSPEFADKISRIGFDESIQKSYVLFLNLSKLIKNLDIIVETALNGLEASGLTVSGGIRKQHIQDVFQDMFTSLAWSTDKLCSECMKYFQSGNLHDLTSCIAKWKQKYDIKKNRLDSLNSSNKKSKPSANILKGNINIDNE